MRLEHVSSKTGEKMAPNWICLCLYDFELESGNYLRGGARKGLPSVGPSLELFQTRRQHWVNPQDGRDDAHIGFSGRLEIQHHLDLTWTRKMGNVVSDSKCSQKTTTTKIKNKLKNNNRKQQLNACSGNAEYTVMVTFGYRWQKNVGWQNASRRVSVSYLCRKVWVLVDPVLTASCESCL